MTKKHLSLLLLLLTAFGLLAQEESNNIAPKRKNSSVENRTISKESGSFQERSGDRKRDGSRSPKGEKLYLFPLDSLVGNILLGSPTEHSIVLSIITSKGTPIGVEYGKQTRIYTERTTPLISSNEVTEIKLTNLEPSTRYFYVITYGDQKSTERSFVTARSKGEQFTFGIQGDSHPERPGKMFNKQLYEINLQNVSSRKPDFYFMMGDDFSIDPLLDKEQPIDPSRVDRIYLNQRGYLHEVGRSSPLFLVNGNHEQAAKYLLDGTPNSPAVLAANARNKYYPLPIPDDFYSGDREKIDHIGYLRDYYAFEWGNALFVVIDPYWHSSSAVDNKAGGGSKRNDLWEITLGDTQYRWLKATLEQSRAKYKFVFAHHVLGTGRGGVEWAPYYEWGGKNRNGQQEFKEQRADWEMPIHDLMVKNRVSIFFQGHDHLFARQEMNGVIYQSVPCPADNSYTAFNAEAYSGIVLPNSGFLQVTVTTKSVKVEYISARLPQDETSEFKNNTPLYSYELY